MGNYIELTIEAADGLQDMLVAELAELGFEGFEETEHLLKAFISETTYPDELLNIIFKKYDVKYSKSIINKQNWNQVWESNFEPVRVDNFVGIRAAFHPAFEEVTHEIVITPKMSFGTGHHATTYMMIQMMESLGFQQKSVFDFGTGTGILAILAEKLGSEAVTAVDNDDWCIENASENILINHCKYIDIQKVEVFDTLKKYDTILANINKHIILENLPNLHKGLKPGGVLLLSGLLEADETDILEAASKSGLMSAEKLQRSGWIALKMVHKND